MTQERGGRDGDAALCFLPSPHAHYATESDTQRTLTVPFHNRNDTAFIIHHKNTQRLPSPCPTATTQHASQNTRRTLTVPFPCPKSTSGPPYTEKQMTFPLPTGPSVLTLMSATCLVRVCVFGWMGVCWFVRWLRGRVLEGSACVKHFARPLFHDNPSAGSTHPFLRTTQATNTQHTSVSHANHASLCAYSASSARCAPFRSLTTVTPGTRSSGNSSHGTV